MSTQDFDTQRYQRHLALPEVGAAGQAKLAQATVAIIGIGGLGSPVALYLAAAGVGRLVLVDHDRVERSNLQRQVLFDDANIGAFKAEVADRRLRAQNPGIEIEAHAVALTAANAERILGACDLVIDGSDRMPTRYLVNDACVLLRKPLVSAAIHRFDGQLTVCLPGTTPCYRCLFPENGETAAPNCADAGVLGVLPGILGTLQAMEAIKLIVGIGRPLAGRLLTYDALEQSFSEFGYARREDCPACGAAPTITELRASAIDEIDVTSCRRRMADGWSPRIVDVREADEYAAGHLPGAENIPLAQLEAVWTSLQGERVLFVCASGARSRWACEQALEQGLENVSTLAGGFQAWQQPASS